MKSAKLLKAQENLTDALIAYQKLAPKAKKPIGNPDVSPKFMWASPDSFRLGYNMVLDCWTAPAIGKIPVIVVPLEKLRGYLK